MAWRVCCVDLDGALGDTMGIGDTMFGLGWCGYGHAMGIIYTAVEF